jgi:hypothetical protein
VRLFRGGGPRGRGSKQGYQHYGSEERSLHVTSVSLCECSKSQTLPAIARTLILGP